MSVQDRGAAWPAPTLARPPSDRPKIGAGVAVYLDENHTARRAGGRWLVAGAGACVAYRSIQGRGC